jgi:signal peptidase I
LADECNRFPAQPQRLHVKRPAIRALAAKAPVSFATDTAVGKDEERQEGSFTWFLVKLLLAVLLLRIFIVAPFSIPSESMMPTLLRGDFLLAAKWPYGWARQSVPFDLPLISGRINPALPERGDVVIFQHPVDDADYIKRAIGLPGDTVEVRGGVPVVNGRPITRQKGADYVVAAAPYVSCAGGERTVTLPAGRSAATPCSAKPCPAAGLTTCWISAPLRRTISDPSPCPPASCS